MNFSKIFYIEKASIIKITDFFLNYIIYYIIILKYVHYAFTKTLKGKEHQ